MKRHGLPRDLGWRAKLVGRKRSDPARIPSGGVER